MIAWWWLVVVFVVGLGLGGLAAAFMVAAHSGDTLDEELDAMTRP